jgi:hypothetical protein
MWRSNQSTSMTDMYQAWCVVAAAALCTRTAYGCYKWILLGTCRYDFQQASTTKQVSSLQASWDNFTDPQSDVVGYTVQFFQQVRQPYNWQLYACGCLGGINACQPVTACRPGRQGGVYLSCCLSIYTGLSWLCLCPSANKPHVICAILLMQVRSKNGTIELTPLTESLSVGLANRVQMLVSQLQDNIMYFAQVCCGGTSFQPWMPASLPAGKPAGMLAGPAAGCLLEF